MFSLLDNFFTKTHYRSMFTAGLVILLILLLSLLSRIFLIVLTVVFSLLVCLAGFQLFFNKSVRDDREYLDIDKFLGNLRKR